MTVSANAVWRVRPSGSNTNGGGFDCSLSSSASGSNGVISGTNTFTDTTAAAFTSGMTGSAINIQGVGQFKFTFVSSTVGTLTVGSSGTLQPIGANGVKFAWTMGSGQDYSQQNAAQATGSHGTASGTTTFTDTVAAAFTSAMVGNAIQIVSGTGFTAGFYFVTAFTSSSIVTLDRSPGTGTVAVWNLGGGWADFWTNAGTSGPLVGGNTVYILGSGIPNPSSYVFDYSTTLFFQSLASGDDTTGGYIVFANDPGTPSYKPAPDTTGGMPCMSLNTGGAMFLNGDFVAARGLWAVNGAFFRQSNTVQIFGCVGDQNSADAAMFINGGVPNTTIVGCETFSSVSGSGSGGALGGFATNGCVIGCNIHDCVANGISIGNSPGFSIVNCIIAKCGSNGIANSCISSAGQGLFIVQNCTIDGNGGSGILLSTQFAVLMSQTTNNIISNHTAGGAAGINCSAGTTAENTNVATIVDYNTFYNNSASYTGIGAGPHDTALGSSPYVASSTENYTLA